MLCDELYKLGSKYLSKTGQKLVERLVTDNQILSAQAVLVGGILARGNDLAPEDRPLADTILRNFRSSLQDLA